jgi:hypothetical protein
MRKFRSIWRACVLVIWGITFQAARAGVITFTFDNVGFGSDPADLISGGFEIDTDTNTLSDVSVTTPYAIFAQTDTTLGVTYNTGTYPEGCGGGPDPNQLCFYPAGNPYPNWRLIVDLQNPITTGGSDAVTGFCEANFTGCYRYIESSGYLDSSTVPEPSPLVMSFALSMCLFVRRCSPSAPELISVRSARPDCRSRGMTHMNAPPSGHRPVSG